VCIRPEFIRVLKESRRDGENIFRGKVESLVFVGDAYEGEIRVGETLLIFRIEPTTAVRRAKRSPPFRPASLLDPHELNTGESGKSPSKGHEPLCNPEHRLQSSSPLRGED